MNDLRDKLLIAADLIGQAAHELDTGSEPCSTCGCTRYQNYTERKLHERLVPMIARLRKIASDWERSRKEAG